MKKTQNYKDKKEKKKEAKQSLIFEGGADGDNFENPDAPPKALTKDQKKLNKYGDDLKGYSVSSTTPGIGDGSVVKERKVTDIICLMIFGVFLVAMLTCTILGFKYGDVEKYLAPFDSNHLICGHPTRQTPGGPIDNSAVGYKRLYFTDLTAKDPFTGGWCVKECPKTTTDPLNFMPIKGKSAPEVTGGQYGTTNVAGYCIPNPS